MERREFKPRTDLAVEAQEMFVEQNPDKKHELDGIIINEYKKGEYKLTRVEIDKKGSERVGKKPGNYITIESQELRKMDPEFGRKSSIILGEEIKRLMEEHTIPDDARCLIVGLGNGYVTPDALGPNTVNKLYVTSHLFKLHPEMIGEGDRSVSAFTPGVMGLTGMETSDIIFGVVRKTNPDFMIVVDALAARSIDRVNTTIQLSDTGINPGSGVGNDRKEVSKETLNIPVFSLGIPTVVDAVTITNDTIDYILKHFGREMEEGDKPGNALTPAGMDFGERREFTDEDLPDEEARQTYLGIVGALKEDEKRQLIREVLRPTGHNLIVTPKEVDEVIEYMSEVVASGINQALHDSVTPENAKHYLN
ncbi:GPR endopeptidase [Piscibacillus salipiscarius]|uniref:Germination protease n=1 Tax=Piscibacillus salipiscarius TaxID=299480 RepID=A0ABW5Q6S5_9BACI